MRQPIAKSLSEAQRNHRGSLAAYSLAKLLRENHSTGDTPEERALSIREEYGILLALEHIAYDVYAAMEGHMLDVESQMLTEVPHEA
jgi:hypothetical protein